MKGILHFKGFGDVFDSFSERSNKYNIRQEKENPNKMKEIAAFIDPFREMWDDRFNKLETIMKKYKSK